MFAKSGILRWCLRVLCLCLCARPVLRSLNAVFGRCHFAIRICLQSRWLGLEMPKIGKMEFKTLEIIKPKFGKCKIPFRFVYKNGDVSLQTSKIEIFSDLQLWGGACSLQPVPSCWSRAQTTKYCFWQLFFPIQLSLQNRWFGCRNYKIVTFQCWLWEILKEEWGHASKLILINSSMKATLITKRFVNMTTFFQCLISGYPTSKIPNFPIGDISNQKSSILWRNWLGKWHLPRTGF